MTNVDRQLVDDKALTIGNVILEQIAKRFSTMRKEKLKLSLRDLSAISGVSTTVISDLENRKYLPKLDVLIRITYALGLDISDLIKLLTPNNVIIDMSSEKREIELSDYLSNYGLKGYDIAEVISFIEFKKTVPSKSRCKIFK